MAQTSNARHIWGLARLAGSLSLLVVGLELGIRWAAPAYDPAGGVVFRLDPAGVPLGPPNSVRRQ